MNDQGIPRDLDLYRHAQTKTDENAVVSVCAALSAKLIADECPRPPKTLNELRKSALRTIRSPSGPKLEGSTFAVPEASPERAYLDRLMRAVSRNVLDEFEGRRKLMEEPVVVAFSTDGIRTLTGSEFDKRDEIAIRLLITMVCAGAITLLAGRNPWPRLPWFLRKVVGMAVISQQRTQLSDSPREG